MKTIIEESRRYDSLDTLQNDLALMDVRETTPFRLNQMELTNYGTVQIQGMYPGNTEYQLSQIALEDAIRRGGLQPSVCQNFFKENSCTLDDAIVRAINAYYKCSSYANSEIKLITRAGKESERVVLGIPSKSMSYILMNKLLSKFRRVYPQDSTYQDAIYMLNLWKYPLPTLWIQQKTMLER